MDSRFRLNWICSVSALALALATTGCGDVGPPKYSSSPNLAAVTANRPILERKLRETLGDLFGPNPYEIRLPKGATLANGLQGTGIRDGGKYLAAQYRESAEGAAQPAPNASAGGAYLYRNHCLHCHGISGDGNGPTAAFLYPRPRDFRNGVYKFTSTRTGAKPTRADLYKTIKNGLHGTSMPSFDALMSEEEIQQVIDYTIFLSIRGETELRMIQEAQTFADEELFEDTKGADGSTTSVAKDVDENRKVEEILHLQEKETPDVIAQRIAASWAKADADQAPPLAARVGAGDSASIDRGKNHFAKLCVECHGYRAEGNGGKYIDREIFNKVVFRMRPLGPSIHAQFEVLENRLKQDAAILEYKSSGRYPVESAAHEGEHHEPEAGVPVDDFIAAQRSVLSYLSDPKQYTDAPHRPLGGEGAEKVQRFNAGLAEYKKSLTPETTASAAPFAQTFFPDLLSTFPRIREKGFQDYLVKSLQAWENSRDDVWRMPLRPANLNAGVYKGGRRPVDLYLRIANGINSSTMPAHFNPGSSSSLKPEDIWDLVNFVIVLPDNPQLLDNIQPPATPPASSPGHELPRGKTEPLTSR